MCENLWDTQGVGRLNGLPTLKTEGARLLQIFLKKYLSVKISKLERYKQIGEFPNLVEPFVRDLQNTPANLCGKWNSSFFKRDAELVLEMGCGWGDFSVGMARNFPERNFLGLDVKGARIWRGAKTSFEEGLKNLGFLRIEGEFVERLFAPGELSEIWITFPTPYLRKPEKMLVSPTFLSRYRRLLSKNGVLHLKTDVELLGNYVFNIWPHCGFELLNSKSEYLETFQHPIPEVHTNFEARAVGLQKRIWHIKAAPTSGNVASVPDEVARCPWKKSNTNSNK
ncbi:MAG: tRNA (guanosine(46)-N7)-methyltransferase TrmB [Candidatus Riflebacteria bacterium]|nr:tRNA (guanosine(46)-N7)-methyltransferase TrmB [Candidatus Riflebacteria bacterium]